MKVSVTWEAKAIGFEDEALESNLDALMESLVRAGAGDPAIGLTSESGAVEITLTVEGPDVDAAVERAGIVLVDALREAKAQSIVWSGPPTRIEPIGA